MQHTSKIDKRVVLVYVTALIVGFSYDMHNPIVPVYAKEVVSASYFDLGTSFPYLLLFIMGLVVATISILKKKTIIA